MTGAPTETVGPEIIEQLSDSSSRKSSENTVISGIYSNCMIDTAPVAQRLRDHGVVTFVHGGSGSDG